MSLSHFKFSDVSFSDIDIDPESNDKLLGGGGTDLRGELNTVLVVLSMTSIKTL